MFPLNQFRRAPSFWCFVASLIYYALAASPWPTPGESAAAIAQGAGITPFISPMHPLWRGVGALLAALPVGPLAWRYNLLAVLCGALCAALCFQLAARLCYAPPNEELPPWFPTLAGVMAAGTLVLLVPVATLSTRAHPGGLELLLLLGSLVCLQRYATGGAPGWFLAFCALCGVSVLEVTGFSAVVPAFAALAAGTLWLRRSSNPWRLLGRGLLVAATCLLLLGVAACGLYLNDASNAWRTELTWPGMARAMASRQWQETRACAFGFGWLLVALTTLVPFLMAVALSLARSFEPALLWRIALCLSLPLLPFLLLFDSVVAPWRVNDDSARFLAPFILVALTPPYALGLCYRWFKPESWSCALWESRALRIAAGLGAVLLAGAAAQRFPAIATRDAGVFYRWARQTVEECGTRRFLVTDGVFDDLLRIAARDARRPLTLLDLSRASQPAYAPYVASVFADSPCRVLARAGLVPVLREWLLTTPDAEHDLAILTQPDLWMASGRAFVPSGGVYLGTWTPDVYKPATLTDQLRQRASLVEKLQGVVKRDAEPAATYARHLLGAESRLANNLGIALENLGARDLAVDAYQASVRIAPDNLCALLNLVYAGAENDSDGESLWVRLKPLLEQQRGTPLPVLVARHGHVRDSDALEFVRPFVPDSVRPVPDPELRQAARDCLRGATVEARQRLEAILARDPAQANAWAMLGVLAYRSEDLATIRRCQRELRRQGQESVPLLLSEGRLCLRTGEIARARQCFTRSLTLAPACVPALESLLALELDAVAPEPRGILTRQILTLDPSHALANFAVGVEWYRAGERELAEAAFRRSLARAPLPDAANNLAWILQERGAGAEALALARQAVALAPDNAAAWDTLGVLLMQGEQAREAAEAFTRALALNPDHAEARQHLAQLAPAE